MSASHEQVTHEQLMAYVDGELHGDERAAVERAIAGSDELAAEVANMRSLNERLRGGLAPVLDEPVPQRLADLLAEPAAQDQSDNVVDLAARRADAGAPTPASDSVSTMPLWQKTGALAAAVLLGVLVGRIGSEPADEPSLLTIDDQLVAGGVLAAALERLPSAATGDGVAVTMSFTDTDGRFCRSFVTTAQAGVGCRDAQHWAIEILDRQEARQVAPQNGSTGYRLAAASLPPAVMTWVDEHIAGDSLDASAEQAAMGRGWRD